MFWLNRIGPTIGASFEPNTSRFVNCTGDFPSPHTLARYDDSPAAPARIVSASPDTVWLTRIVIVANPCSSAPSAPAAIAASERDASAPTIPGRPRVGGVRPADGAEQHHALDAEVEHAGALGEHLAQRGEEDRRAVEHRRGQRDDEQAVVHAVTAADRRQRMR